jgi:hypothetical protein
LAFGFNNFIFFAINEKIWNMLEIKTKRQDVNHELFGCH